MVSLERVVPELAPGVVVASKFRLERLLGEGGVGAVWMATNTATRSSVALKFLKSDDGLEVTRRRLVREARAAAAVQHPNVRQVFDVIELTDGSPVLVMEYLDGESLSDRLRARGKLDVDELATVMVQVVSGVGAAHAAGLIHRDLKPQNIFLVRGGLDAVKVVDFGIAKWRDSDAASAETMQTASGAILGTPYYMSPEQVFGEKAIDHRTDVWSIGLVMYECLSGTLPTRADNVGQVMKVIVSKPLPPITSLVPELPPDLADLITRMLTRAPDRRPASLEEVLAVLERHTELRAPRVAPPAGAGVSASPPDDLEVHPEAPDPPGATTVLGEATRAIPAPVKPSRSWLFIAGGATALVAAAAWSLGSGRGAASSASATSPASTVSAASAHALPSAPASAGPISATTTSPAALTASAEPLPPTPSATASAKASVTARPAPSGPRSTAGTSASAPTPSAFTPSQKFE